MALRSRDFKNRFNFPSARPIWRLFFPSTNNHKKTTIKTNLRATDDTIIVRS